MINADLASKLELQDASIVVLSGGIGNQLFQYCLAREIEKKTGVDVYLDFTLLSFAHRVSNQRQSIRALNSYPIQVIDNSQLFQILFARYVNYFSTRFKREYLRTLENVAKSQDARILKQNKMLYDDSIVPVSKAIFFGSFTSHKYWKENFREFATELEIQIQRYTSSLGKSTNRGNSQVVIHARRGDYVNNPKIRGVHGAYGIDFYLKAFSKFSTADYKTLSILSDNSDFARELSDSIKARFKGIDVMVPQEQDPLFILNSYSHSELFIGSNSTFSWWLANLGKDKIRVMPSRWFVKDDYGFNPEDYFPCDTELLDAPFEYI